MISLTAEQKTIEGIFGSPNETYVETVYTKTTMIRLDEF